MSFRHPFTNIRGSGMYRPENGTDGTDGTDGRPGGNKNEAVLKRIPIPEGQLSGFIPGTIRPQSPVANVPGILGPMGIMQNPMLAQQIFGAIQPRPLPQIGALQMPSYGATLNG